MPKSLFLCIIFYRLTVIFLAIITLKRYNKSVITKKGGVVVVIITLKETLSERGITQSELSKLAGLRPSTVSSLLNGSTRIEFETIEKIAKALETDDIREIISLEERKEK